MKTLSALALVSFTTALVLLPFSATLGAVVLFATGFAAIVVSDYNRSAHLVRLPATAVLAARRERFGLAA